MDDIDEMIEKQLKGSNLTPEAKEKMRRQMRDNLAGQKQDTVKPLTKLSTKVPAEAVTEPQRAEPTVTNRKPYKPKTRTMISLYIDNNVHAKLKQVCDANNSRGIKTAVSDVINLAIVKHLEGLER